MPPIEIKVKDINASITMIVPRVQGVSKRLGVLVELERKIHGEDCILVEIPPNEHYTRDTFINEVTKATEQELAKLLARKQPPVTTSSIEKEQILQVLRLAERLTNEFLLNKTSP